MPDYDSDQLRRLDLRRGRLPQDFAEFFSSGCHVALCGTGDGQPTAARPSCRSGTKEQAFANRVTV
jgi:hypothetical protein